MGHLAKCTEDVFYFSIASNIRRVAKFRENRCKDGEERVFGDKKNLMQNIMVNGHSLLHRRRA